MTLAGVAVRFEEAGIAERSRALLSLQRCKPDRPPVYRDGDLYHLDPHDDELDLWVFRLDLRPPKVARTPPKSAEQRPLPAPETPLTPRELDEAWKDANLFNWSAQRLVAAVLDAHGGPLAPAEVVAAVAGRTRWHLLKEGAAKFKRRGSAIDVLPDGRWAVHPGAETILPQARAAARDRIAMARRHAAMRPDPALMEQRRAEREKKRAAHGAELASLSRALLVAFPPARPQAVALLDVGEHRIRTFVNEELAALPTYLVGYDILGAVDVRGLLRRLGFDPGERRLAELGPPQKTKKLNKRGRTLKVTTALLIQGSCGISRPLGDGKKLDVYLANGVPTDPLDAGLMLATAFDGQSIPYALGAERGMFVARFGSYRIDVFTPSIDFAWEAMRSRLQKKIDGQPVWFLSAESLAVFKLPFFRPKDIVDPAALDRHAGCALGHVLRASPSGGDDWRGGRAGAQVG